MMNKEQLNKFKPGDRVVLIKDLGEAISNYRIGDVGEVTVINNSSTYPLIVKFSEGKSTAFDYKELEHEHIFNSPLYQALK